MASSNSKLSIIGKPVWFITGCSTGFGREIAKQVLQSGYRVVVTARNLDNIADLAAHGDALMLKLDVTDRLKSPEVLPECWIQKTLLFY